MPPPSSSSKPPAEPTHTSRRGALRVTGLTIDVRYSIDGDGALRRGTIRDLSATGALLETEQPLSVGQVVHLEFATPKGPRIKGSATVARCLQPKDGLHAAGLAFDISVDAELELAQWVFDRV